MYFNLVVGFQGVPLSAADKKKAKKGAAVAELETFSLLLADTVKIPEAAAPPLDEKLATKYDYQLGKMMWEIGEEGQDDKEEDDEGAGDGGDGRGRSSTRAAANIVSSRLRERKKEGDDGLTQGEIDKQMKALLERKMREKAERAETTGKKKDEGNDGDVEELQAYRCVGVCPLESVVLCRFYV